MTAHVVRLVGVYNADGSLLGELSYFMRARVGRADCALCKITHGRVRERAGWRASRATLPVPFVTFHRDDQPPEARAAGGDDPPVVLVETDDDRLTLLLDRDALVRCTRPEHLVDAIALAVEARRLTWPTGADADAGSSAWPTQVGRGPRGPADGVGGGP